MAQQTAVEWLEDKLDELIPFVNEKTAIAFNKLIQQAKEMEKEQKKDAWVDGIKTQRIIKSTEVDECFNNYYTETYTK